ncbi:MAG: hypothetical protein COX19_16060 [Desulfobacterales bacterium CG23_combo_of_CG06-09_8_20_14_all_51_8]|nr:MAG: hypothetical protein COX19_16060 [Desulfobacterales bacterium CG23_combo_of_CG06-09_8_20_14_all_51_8]
MNPCDNCAIDDKIYECCGRFPETGESAMLEIAPSRKIFACPHLDASGKCGIYDHRPLACQAHFCFQYATPRAMGAGFEGFKHLINLRDDDEPL